jgi:hypothetical protein
MNVPPFPNRKFGKGKDQLQFWVSFYQILDLVTAPKKPIIPITLILPERVKECTVC